MERDRDFDKLTIHELIADDRFMQWLKQPDEQLNEYWQSVMTAHPEARRTVEEARGLVGQMDFAAHIPGPGRKEFVFDRIRTACEIKEEAPETKKEQQGIISIRRYLQIAATVILVSVSGMWLYTHYGIKSKGVLSGPGNMGTSANTGMLFLSNGKTLRLDGLQSGTIVADEGLRISMPGPGHLVFEGNTGLKTIGVDSVRSPIGQVWQLDLADKSRVWLSSGSVIRLGGSRAASDRGAEISGQAYFEVSHHKDVPFVVRLNEVEVGVLGTEFDVVNYPDGSEVTLVKGLVQVKHAKGSVHRLKVGERADYNGAETDPDIAKADVKQIIAWKEGIFSFNKMEITEVMTLIGRWYGVKVVYSGSKPKARISGTIPHEGSLREVLDILQSIGGDARFQIKANQIIVRSL